MFVNRVLFPRIYNLCKLSAWDTSALVFSTIISFDKKSWKLFVYFRLIDLCSWSTQKPFSIPRLIGAIMGSLSGGVVISVISRSYGIFVWATFCVQSLFPGQFSQTVCFINQKWLNLECENQQRQNTENLWRVYIWKYNWENWPGNNDRTQNVAQTKIP